MHFQLFLLIISSLSTSIPKAPMKPGGLTKALQQYEAAQKQLAEEALVAGKPAGEKLQSPFAHPSVQGIPVSRSIKNSKQIPSSLESSSRYSSWHEERELRDMIKDASPRTRTKYLDRLADRMSSSIDSHSSSRSEVVMEVPKKVLPKVLPARLESVDTQTEQALARNVQENLEQGHVDPKNFDLWLNARENADANKI